MTDARKKLLERVKAILSKTMENGCTEGEAIAALAKARELMATYEIDEKELAEFGREKSRIHKTEMRDPYDIKKGLCVNIGKFTSTKAFRDADKTTICFAGKDGDIIFATWLLDTLQSFVMRELRNYQKEKIKKGSYHSNNLTSVSFVAGCTHRINEKLKELAPIDWAKTQELIVKELNMSLTKSRGPSKNVHEASAKAGMQAGNSATFNRPINAGGMKVLK